MAMRVPERPTPAEQCTTVGGFLETGEEAEEAVEEEEVEGEDGEASSSLAQASLMRLTNLR